MFDYLAGELTAFNLFGPFHLAGEVVGDGFRGNRLFQSRDDQVGDVLPAHVFEHHDTREDDAAGINRVLIGIFGGGAVGGFEDGVAGDVVDVAAGGDADAAD